MKESLRIGNILWMFSVQKIFNIEDKICENFELKSVLLKKAWEWVWKMFRKARKENENMLRCVHSGTKQNYWE